jgi:hypothetical protein
LTTKGYGERGSEFAAILDEAIARPRMSALLNAESFGWFAIPFGSIEDLAVSPRHCE